MGSGKIDCNLLSDKEIVSKSLEDINYFRCLFDRYENRLKNYIHRISGFDEFMTEDILQNAFIKIWRNLNNYDDTIPVSSFIYNIVHNETISIWRHLEVQKKMKQNIDNHEENYFIDNDNNTISSQKILKTLNSIPEKYREILILKFYENMDYEEISNILKIPEGTVATRINRAKSHFAKISDKTDFFNNF
jgi:RNA polymerase sigma-70 factor, ECF subfamily